MSKVKHICWGVGIGAGIGLVADFLQFNTTIPRSFTEFLCWFHLPSFFCAQVVSCIRVNMASNETHALPWDCIPSLPALVIFIFLEWVLIGGVCGFLWWRFRSRRGH